NKCRRCRGGNFLAIVNRALLVKSIFKIWAYEQDKSSNNGIVEIFERTNCYLCV
ncbi:MAG: hypothetical protein ACI9T7_002764, partial [Oleiphilaceae bacterium]